MALLGYDFIGLWGTCSRLSLSWWPLLWEKDHSLISLVAYLKPGFYTRRALSHPTGSELLRVRTITRRKLEYWLRNTLLMERKWKLILFYKYLIFSSCYAIIITGSCQNRTQTWEWSKTTQVSQDEWCWGVTYQWIHQVCKKNHEL